MEYPLHNACMNNDARKVQELLEANDPMVAVKQVDGDGRTPLHWAVSMQSEPVIRLLLPYMKSIDLDTLKDEAGWTPFHIACAVGNMEIVDALYHNNHDSKPDLNLQTTQGVTALHLAVSKKHLEVCKFLVKLGASVRVKDKKLQIPLHRAAAVGSLGIVEYLCNSGKSPINWTDISGWTPLFHALAEGHADIAVLLVNNFDAEYDIEDKDGKKPLDYVPADSVKDYFMKNT
ncbi:putative 26S proteasome regulatory subunit p28 [Nakaseomyces bracarensis]|uniref:26S proteasome regulatory subunit p28 n=1 Tax=Nakaseomyces bracarensis TaxID=273131 RepID=A0ABR4NQZ9_9SACH